MITVHRPGSLTIQDSGPVSPTKACIVMGDVLLIMTVSGPDRAMKHGIGVPVLNQNVVLDSMMHPNIVDTGLPVTLFVAVDHLMVAVTMNILQDRSGIPGLIEAVQARDHLQVGRTHLELRGQIM
ncbi:MAG: hypothetical protein EP297_06850 [Gammaproteobacteria bacterium]|nr:MAG: hypothetical protein EP297_06850 [Gammaproteobacteria bacterium]